MPNQNFVIWTPRPTDLVRRKNIDANWLSYSDFCAANSQFSTTTDADGRTCLVKLNTPGCVDFEYKEADDTVGGAVIETFISVPSTNPVKKPTS